MAHARSTPIDWLDLLREFGFPTVCVCALSWAIWRSLMWLGNRILLPLVERHVKFLDDLTAHNERLVESLHQVCRATCHDRPDPAAMVLPMPETKGRKTG